MNVIEDYISKCKTISDTVLQQHAQIALAAQWCADSILAGRVVHLFGSGHSRIMVEEMWPRYGSFPGFNPIVELSLTFYNLVTGPNGIRQAMFLENVSGLAERILRNFNLDERDTALIISSGGTNVVPVEMGEAFWKKGIKVISIISMQHAAKATSKREDNRKLADFSDIVLDTGAPAGDAMVTIPGLTTPVAPGSTFGGVLLINTLKAEIAKRLTDAGQPPRVLTAAATVGAEKAVRLFESAYDEHANRMAELYTMR